MKQRISKSSILDSRHKWKAHAVFYRKKNWIVTGEALIKAKQHFLSHDIFQNNGATHFQL